MSAFLIVSGMEPTPTVIGQGAGYTLDKPPVYHGANTDRQATINTQINTYLDKLTSISLECGGNMQTPHKKAPGDWRIQTRDPLPVRC